LFATVAPSPGVFSMAIGGCGSGVGAGAEATASPADGFSDFPQAAPAAINRTNPERRTPRIIKLLTLL
jgi:hypothetical protein